MISIQIFEKTEINSCHSREAIRGREGSFSLNPIEPEFTTIAKDGASALFLISSAIRLYSPAWQFLRII